MKPQIALTIDGEPASDELQRRLRRASASQEAGDRAGSLDLAFHNDPPLELPRVGVEIGVRMGYHGRELHRVGAYVVDSVEAGGPRPEISLRASAINWTDSATAGGAGPGMREPRTRVWEGLTLAGIAETIAGEHGLTPKIHPDLASVEIPHLDQIDQSDQSILTELGRRYNAVATVLAGRLMMTPRGSGQGADGSSLPAVEIDVTEASRWSISQDSRAELQSVTAHYHDFATAVRMAVTVGSGEPATVLRDVYPTEVEARAAARARLAESRRQAMKLSLSLPARPDLFLESPITLPGVPPGYADGEWVINSVSHEIGRGGTTRLKAEPRAT
ncbi:hypothetical protein SAMN05660831_02112 [Thiohalospira halophila DSM 15071]|uniref:Phage protein D n=1 Tax=Thiohalospira halophila DSM 15071 TaxID=1123397 RepID=A0A1I1UD34_9GAMM|nr:contractile injection system protein, VgrG/Pvc8 family [Thiohalospira halophila]SFD68659.1 hypothetical protein SAMN05660831_02112 [Thiohalospira halophila DSM 15071]